jgi:hypothetical protein
MPGYVKPPVNGRVNGTMEMIPSLATQTPLTIKGAVSQSANLLNIQNSSGASIASIDSTGRQILPSSPRFLAYPSANFSHSPGPQNVPAVFNTVVYNIGSNYNTSTGLFTAPIAGTYVFTAGIYQTADVSQLWFIVNGARERSFTLTDTGNANHAGTGIIYLSAGDTLGFQPWSGGGTTTIITNSSHTYFRGAWVS